MRMRARRCGCRLKNWASWSMALLQFDNGAVIKANAEGHVRKAVVVTVTAQAIAACIRYDANIEPIVFWCLIGVFAASLDARDKLLSHYGGLILRLVVHFVKHFAIRLACRHRSFSP